MAATQPSLQYMRTNRLVETMLLEGFVSQEFLTKFPPAAQDYIVIFLQTLPQISSCDVYCSSQFHRTRRCRWGGAQGGAAREETAESLSPCHELLFGLHLFTFATTTTTTQFGLTVDSGLTNSIRRP